MWQTCTQEINSRTSCRARSRKTHPGIETPYPSPSFFFYQVIKLLAHQTSSNILQKHYHPPKTTWNPKTLVQFVDVFSFFQPGMLFFFRVPTCLFRISSSSQPKVQGRPPSWNNSCDKRFDHTNDNDDVAGSKHWTIRHRQNTSCTSWEGCFGRGGSSHRTSSYVKWFFFTPPKKTWTYVQLSLSSCWLDEIWMVHLHLDWKSPHFTNLPFATAQKPQFMTASRQIHWQTSCNKCL